MRVFILDDEVDKFPKAGILAILHRHTTIVGKSVGHGKKVYTPPFDLILLDHDLNGFHESWLNPNTGYAFAKWLIDTQEKTEVILHGSNPIGRGHMREAFNAAGWLVHEHCFGSNYLNFLHEFVGERT